MAFGLSIVDCRLPLGLAIVECRLMIGYREMVEIYLIKIFRRLKEVLVYYLRKISQRRISQ